MILNVTSAIQCDLITLTQTTAWISWLFWHQEDQTVPGSPPRYTERFHASRAFWGKLRSKGQNVWTLFVTIIFSKPEDGRGKFRRPVCRVRVRHPDSLQVLLGFPAGRKYFRISMGGLGYRHVGRLYRWVQIFGGSEFCFFVIFVRCAFVCVCVTCLSFALGGCRCR
jgi:hypothetical protein